MIRLHAKDIGPGAPSADLPANLRGAIVALGNFDGVHIGHQKVIGTAVAMARDAGRPVIVATFDPHPVRYFRPDTPPFRLTTLDQREELFAGLGADAMLIFRFDRELAETPHETFAQWLIGPMGAAGVVTGIDFTYGKARGGNSQMLAAACAAAGCRFQAVAPVEAEGAIASSSRIRAALQTGDLPLAERLLTRPFAIRGEVIHGDKLGRTIGYPTANIEMGSYLRPKFGIYAVNGRLPDGRVLNGAANLGIRPSFDPPKELLEPFFFDFGEPLYGQVIEVALRHYLRPEEKFDTLEALTEQMDADCERAKALLSA